MASNPTAFGATVTKSAGETTPLSSLFFYSDADNDIVAFAVKDREFGGGYLTRDGTPQTENLLFDDIPINELFRWAFVAGPGGSTSTVGFNAIDSRGAFNPSAVATVNVAAPAAHNPTASGVTVTKSAGESTSLSSLFNYSDADNDIVAFAVRDRDFGGGYLTKDGIPQSETALFDGIPINDLFRWTFVAGPAGSSSAVGFNAIDSRGVYSLPATATVNAATAPDDLADEASDGTAPIGAVSVGGAASGFIGPADANDTFGDKDVFRVFLTQGETYQIRMQSAVVNGQALQSGLFTVRDPNNFDVELNRSAEGSNVTVSITAATTGDYSIRAGSGGLTPGQGGYQISVTNITPADDFTNTIGTTGMIAINGMATGVIETVNDTDWFKTTLVAGRTYRFDLDGSATGQGTLVDPYMSVRDATGVRRVESDNGGAGLNSSFVYTAAVSGTHFLAAGAGYNPNGVGTYSARLTDITAPDDFADDVADATAPVARVSVGGVAPGFIGPADADDGSFGDKDVFKVFLTQGETYQIRMQSTAVNGQTLQSGLFTVRAPNNFDSVLKTSAEGSNVTVSIIAATTGDHYIRAGSAAASGQGGYQLSVTNTAPAVADDTVREGIDTATVISPIGSSITGAIDAEPIAGDGAASDNAGGYIDKDWFKVTLTQGRVYDISLIGEASGGKPALADGYFTVRDSAGNRVTGLNQDVYDTYDLAGAGARVEFGANQTSGTYYIAVGAGGDDFGTATGAYRLQVIDVTATEPGGTLATAKSLDLSSGSAAQSGIAGFGGDAVDTFKIVAPSAGTLTLDLAGLRSNLDVRLLSSSGQILASSTQSGNQPEQITANVSAGQAVYAEIRSPLAGQGSPYTLDVALNATPPPGGGALETAETLFDGKKFLTLADFALAAYEVQSWEPEATQYPFTNDSSPEALDARVRLLASGNWEAVSLVGLPTPATLSGGIFQTAFKDGFYTSGNAGAFVARSSDSLVLAFRGTNDNGVVFDATNPISPRTPDEKSWSRMVDHYDLLRPVVDAVDQYVRDHPEISRVYVTGHSLGAGMVEAFLLDHRVNPSLYEGVAFADPGYAFVPVPPDERLTHFWNVDDPINITGFFGKEYSGDQNRFLFNKEADSLLPNNELREAFLGGEGQHSLTLYRQIAVQLYADGLDDQAIKSYDKFVVPIEKLNGVYTVTSDASNTLQGLGMGGVLLGGKGSDNYQVESKGRNTIIDTKGVTDKIVVSNGRFDHFELGGNRYDLIVVFGADRVHETGRLTIKNFFLPDNRIEVFTVMGAAIALPATADKVPLFSDVSVTSPIVTESAGSTPAILYKGTSSLSDTISVASQTVDAVVDLVAGAGKLIYSALAGSSSLLAASPSGSSGEFNFSLTGFENVYGGSGDDHLTGDSKANVLKGGDGDDLVDGGGGNDTIIGGSGEGDDTYIGGEGIDTVSYTSATEGITVNLLFGHSAQGPEIGTDALSGIENVVGGDGDDSISGDDGANVLEGDRGADYVGGQGGDDTLYGGLGDDQLEGGDGVDLLGWRRRR